MPIPVSVFISYAHKDNDGQDQDNRWFDRLFEQLKPLVDQQQVDAWSDKKIEMGDDWHQKIQTSLQDARVAVLLVSPAFLASKYIRNSELPILLKQAKERGTIILSVLLRHCLFTETKFKFPHPVDGPEEVSLAALQSAHSPDKPLNSLPQHEQDKVLLDVARRILKEVDSLPSPGGQITNTRVLSPKSQVSCLGESGHTGVAGNGRPQTNLGRKRNQFITGHDEILSGVHIEGEDVRLDLKQPITIQRIRKQEKIDASIIANVAFHPNGRLMAYNLDNRLFLLPLNDVFPRQLGIHSRQQEIKSSYIKDAHIYRITDISFSPDGGLVASSDATGYVKFWSLENRECIVELKKHDDAVARIAFSPQGDLFASAGFDEFIHIWRTKDILQSPDPKPYATFEKKSQIKKVAHHQHDIEQIISMAFSHDGKHLASGDQQGVVVVREIDSREEVYRKKIQNSLVSDMAFSPTNKFLLATASWDKRIRLTDFSKTKTVTLGKHMDSVVSIAFAPRGDILISSGTDKHVKLWDVEERQLLYTHTNEDGRPVEKVAFFPNQYDFATDKYSSDISLWGISNQREVTNTRIVFE